MNLIKTVSIEVIVCVHVRYTSSLRCKQCIEASKLGCITILKWIAQDIHFWMAYPHVQNHPDLVHLWMKILTWQTTFLESDFGLSLGTRLVHERGVHGQGNCVRVTGRVAIVHAQECRQSSPRNMQGSRKQCTQTIKLTNHMST